MDDSKHGIGGGVYRRGKKIWWIRYAAHGERHRESSKSEKRSDAERLLRKRLSAVDAGKPVGASVERTTFGDLSQMLLDNYRANGRRSVKRAEFALNRLRQFFGAETRASAITQDRVTKYVVARQAQNIANATINNELSMLNRAFAIALDAGKVASAPRVKKLHVSNTRTGFFEREQCEAVLRHLPEYLRNLIRAAYITGWRTRSELTTRTWKNIDFANNLMRLEPGESKNLEARNFPLSPELRVIFEAQREHVSKLERKLGRVIPHVFVKPDGSPIGDFRYFWRRACINAGVPGRLVHDLRRTAVRNLERAGVPRSAAMKLTGHKTESVYRRYAIVDSAMLQDAVAKLSALHALDAAQ
jgi:integrase